LTTQILAVSCAHILVLEWCRGTTAASHWFWRVCWLFETAKLAVWALALYMSAYITAPSDLDTLVETVFGVCVSLEHPRQFYLPLLLEWISMVPLFVLAARNVWTKYQLWQRHTPKPTPTTPLSRVHASRVFAWIPKPIKRMLEHDVASLYMFSASMAPLILLPVSLSQIQNPSGFSSAFYNTAWLLLVRWSIQGVAAAATTTAGGGGGGNVLDRKPSDAPKS